ncbi:T-cell surface antigen CD2-like [Xenopus laevis]|uniref:Ig-like domain-containing protein n=2 Tax=Xenopus laevis TaxID=8355 RepID=A0A974DIY9_XENLA|nr:T-cell surface antigen CD2-like [Xenopus laevis]OCT91437.1 hypothetical protein XELAEV_18014491mg [Xenopus laevis]
MVMLLHVCFGLWILLCTGWAADIGPMYVAQNGSVLLNIPGYPNAENDQVTWKNGDGYTMGRFRDSLSYHQVKGCECELFRNGSLFVKRLDVVGDQTYKVMVYNQGGKQISSHSITVTVIKRVAAPVLSYTCGGKHIRLHCEVSDEDAPDEMKIMWNNSLLAQSTKSKSVGKNISVEIDGNVTCTARNRVSENTHTNSINCHTDHQELEWFMIPAIAAGGVAFLIFIILLSYFVSRSRCKKTKIGEEEASICYKKDISIQERQLPSPFSQPDTQTLIQPPTQTDPEPQPKPPAPRGHSKSRPPKQSKRGAHSKRNVATAEKQAPQHQKQQNLSQSERPPVPNNHPNTRPPRPQPRTKSRPAHQHQQ